jgi:hypothetical protein
MVGTNTACPGAGVVDDPAVVELEVPEGVEPVPVCTVDANDILVTASEKLAWTVVKV